MLPLPIGALAKIDTLLALKTRAGEGENESLILNGLHNALKFLGNFRLSVALVIFTGATCNICCTKSHWFLRGGICGGKK
jgi:hypothetical protein